MPENQTKVWHYPWVRTCARLCFASIILVLLFRRVDFTSVIRALGKFDIRWLLPIISLPFAVRYILACQMSLGSKQLKMHVSIFDLFRINLISTFYSLIVPGAIVGGGAGWYKLYKAQGKGVEAWALLIYFRFINTLTLVAVGVVGMWFDARLHSTRMRAAIIGLAILIGLLSLPLFFPAVTRALEKLWIPLWSRFRSPIWIAEKGRAIWQALLTFQSTGGRTIAQVLGLSLLSHALGIFNFWLYASAVHIHLSFFVLGWIRTLVSLLQLLPVSVAGLGVREASVVLILPKYGVPAEQALSFSLVIFAMFVFTGLVGGVFELWDLLKGKKRK